MSGLLYFIPQRKHVELGQVAELGLAYAFEDDCTPRGVERGPDDCAGVVLADSTRVQPRNHGYWTDHRRSAQEWLKIPGNPAGAWVGRTLDEPLRPADVARNKQLDGHLVDLADGQQWLAPVARGLAEMDGELVAYTALPRLTGVDDEGQWIQGELVRRYARLWEVAAAWWDAIMGAEQTEEGTLEFDFAGRNDAAVVVLATNYRLQKAEIALLGLFDQNSAAELLWAAVDWPTMKEWTAKKKAEQTEAAPKGESAAGA